MVDIKPYADLNIMELELIGSGTQGKVYRLDSERCIKIFKSKQVCKNELKTLTMAQADAHFPKLYEWGSDYIIREYINGTELNRYLSSHKLTFSISYKVIELYEAMKKVGYIRLDAAIFHVLITPSSGLKLIDTAKAMKKKTSCPNLIISGLEELGYKDDFLNFVKQLRPDLYVKWINYTKINYKKIGV